jgi:hypothetical protein
MMWLPWCPEKADGGTEFFAAVQFCGPFAKIPAEFPSGKTLVADCCGMVMTLGRET